MIIRLTSVPEGQKAEGGKKKPKNLFLTERLPPLPPFPPTRKEERIKLLTK
jgi:hypothetical protein